MVLATGNRSTLFSSPAVERYRRPLARAFALGAAACRPVEAPASLDWCTNNLHLPPETSAGGGPIDFVSRPYWRQPIELLDDPDVDTITIMGDAQGGKTIELMAMLTSRAKCDPAPSMAVTPDQDSCREFRDKVYSMCEVSPALEGSIPPEANRNDRWLDLGNMVCYLAYSGSRQRMRGRPCKYVFCTEVDVWSDDPRLGQSARLIQARTKAFAEHTVVYESTPTDDASAIAALYRRSDQRKFQVPCPKCNHWQELRFFPYARGKRAGRGGVAGLQDKHGAWLSPEQAKVEAYYVGECGCKITSHQKSEMSAAGRWVPKGQRIKGERIVGKADRPGRHAGFHMSSLYAPHESFGSMGYAYLDHRETGALREFFNNWLGLPFLVASRMPNWRKLGQRLAWPHRRGTVPAEAYFLTSMADVQQDRVYNVVRAWGDRRTSWLVDWEEYGRDEPKPQPAPSEPADESSPAIASDLAHLVTDVLAVRFPLVAPNPLGQVELSVRVLGVDTNYRMFEVHDFVKEAERRFGDRVRALRGDHKVDPTELFRMNLVEKNARTGKRYEGGLKLWGVYVNAFREQLLALFDAPVDQPGAWRLTADVVSIGQSYLRQLVNQAPKTEILPSGKTVVKWITRDQGLGEHYWDCEVGNLALAEMVSGGNWDVPSWASPPKTESRKAVADSLAPLPRSTDDYYSAR